MAAQITIVEGGRILGMNGVERLWFFPDASEHLRYSPHFHMIYRGGFRTNFPLTHGFVVVHEGKLSVKSFFGETRTKIHVQDQVWFLRGTSQRAPWEYAKMLRVAPVYASPKPIYG
jgi:hypothetical protein